MKYNYRNWLTVLALFLFMGNVFAQTTQIKGLTVIVEFLDAPFTNSVDSVAMMMNTPGFSKWGNKGSVRDYYYTQSDGKLTITSDVIKVSLPYYVSDYWGPNATRKDISDIVDAINQTKPAGFQNLTIDPVDGTLLAFIILVKTGGQSVSFGPQPGSNTIKNNGVDLIIAEGNITKYGPNDNPSRNTICHEMGHCIFGWRDFYVKSEVNGHSNLGHYCVMGSGGTNYNASPLSATFRYKKGWITTVTEIPNTTTTYTITSNSRNKVFKYTNPANPFEYFLIEALYVNGDYPAIDGENFTMDQGLAVWYVDEERLGYNVGAPKFDPKIKLIQADGLDEMHDLSIIEEGEEKANIRGDLTDFFDNQFNTLSAATHPFFRWKDGGEPGLIITNISAPGATMQFTVQARPNTISAQLTYSNGGSISPRGTFSYTSSSPKTFTIVPEMGYVVANVVVDGVSKGAVTSYIFNTSGNHTISATFQASNAADAVPSPWQEIEIGNSRKAGTAGARSGVFGLESNHYDIWGTEDGLSFIYQPLTGNGEIIAKVASMNFPGDWAKAGIMMRESLTANSKHFMLVRTPANNLAPQYRPTTGGDSYHNPQETDIKADYFKYNYLKIVRQNNQFTSYCSLDGVSNWVQLATYSIPMNATIYVGMCASAASDVVATKVTFSNVTVIKSNTPPSVSITSPSNNATFTPPASITINANASDADGTVSKVEFFNGSTLLGTDLTSPYSYTWSNVAAGTYTITAKATDNLSGATTSSAVTVIVASGNLLCFEAEAGTNQSSTFPYQVKNDVNASGGQYIVVPNGAGNQSSPPTTSIMTYNFNVGLSGTYNIWVRVIAPTSNDNEMYLRTDASSYAAWTPGSYTVWTWKKWAAKSLNAGAHTLSVARKEDGLQIDKIYLTTSSSTPSGLGCSTARMEEEGYVESQAGDMFENNTLLLFPNPSNDAFSITTTGKAISYLSVTNAFGIKVFATSNIEKGIRTDFGTDFENGLYNVIVKYEDGTTESLKVIKQK